MSRARVSIRATGEAGRAATADRLFRRALLLTPHEASLQDIADLVEMAHLAGRDELGRLLLAGIGLELGFGAEGRSWWGSTGRDTGFWSIGEATPDRAESEPAFPVTVAVSELRELMRIEPDAAMREDEGGGAGCAPSVMALARWGQRFAAALDDLLSDGAFRIVPFINALQPEASAWPSFDPSKQAGETTETLALGILFNRFKHFAVRAESFRSPPLGSDRLLEAGMRLSQNALGTLLGNADTLLRTERDILDWTLAAAPEGMSPEWIDKWRLLLAMTLRTERWNRFVTLTVRSGREKLTEMLLDHLVVQAKQDDYRLHHLRDCCLEQGSADLAVAAQRQIAEQRPNDLNEWVILADLAGLMGSHDQAQALLARCLAINPSDANVLARRTALAAGEFDSYIRQHGFFGDPVDGPARLTAFGATSASSGTVAQ